MSENKGTRINKFLSEAGFCSRREADKLIEKNRVKINGKVPLIGTKVMAGDRVSVDKKVSIFTIRHFNRNTLKHIKKLSQKILLEQRTYKTLQLVLSKTFKQENLFEFFEL